MGIKIRKHLVPSHITSKVTYGGTNPKRYIVIHETANTSRGANASAHARLQANGNSRSASWHFQVDDKEIVQSFSVNAQCWHAGSAKYNRESIAIEICVNQDGNYLKAVDNAIELTRYLMNRYNISASNVIQHFHASGKNCPTFLRSGNRGINWSQFKSKIKGSSSIDGGSNTSSPSTLSILKQGDKGNKVKKLQQKLMNLGYDLGRYGADGDFGTITLSTVKKFQKDNGLVIDGIVGNATQKKLKECLDMLKKLEDRVKKLERELKSKLDKPSTNQKPDPTHAENVKWAKDNKISDGSNPYMFVSRQQLMSMIKNYDRYRG